MREVDQESGEAEIVDNYRLDHLYTHPFRGGAGKYFTVVSKDDQGTPTVVEFEHPWPARNKIKTRLTLRAKAAAASVTSKSSALSSTRGRATLNAKRRVSGRKSWRVTRASGASRST